MAKRKDQLAAIISEIFENQTRPKYLTITEILSQITSRKFKNFKEVKLSRSKVKTFPFNSKPVLPFSIYCQIRTLVNENKMFHLKHLEEPQKQILVGLRRWRKWNEIEESSETIKNIEKLKDTSSKIITLHIELDEVFRLWKRQSIELKNSIKKDMEERKKDSQKRIAFWKENLEKEKQLQ